MRVLLDHPVPSSELTDIADPSVVYRPELATADERTLGQELTRVIPDVLLTRRRPAAVTIRRWAAAGRVVVVVRIGADNSTTDDDLDLSPDRTMGRVVVSDASRLVDVLAVAERAWSAELLSTPVAATGRSRVQTPGGDSVVLVGAGVVNLITALRLAREGFTPITICDRSPDPRADAPWESYGCSRGGADARMFTLTEADGYYFGPNHAGPNHAGPNSVGPNSAGPNSAGSGTFCTPISAGGWRIADPARLTTEDREWVSANSATPGWLARSYTRDVLFFNRASRELWRQLMRDEPTVFDGVGLREGILRLYSDEQHLREQIARQHEVGAEPVALTADEIALRHPALRDAARRGAIAGGIQVVGFTLQVHALMARLVSALEQCGTSFFWNREVTGLRRDDHGLPTALCAAGGSLEADHFVLSPGAYGADLLRGTAADGLIHGMLGAWVTLPNTEAGLTHSLKIARRGHLAEDTNVTVTTGPGGEPHLVIGSGYGWTGHNPGNIDTTELDILHDAVADTASTFFPAPYAAARRSGLLTRSRRFCIRPWTASSLGILDVTEKPDGGFLVVTGGHNTGGFAQAPVIAAAVSAALGGMRHPMHIRYHPDRHRAFLSARDIHQANLGPANT